MSFKPVSVLGQLTTAATIQTLYKVPDGHWALVIGFSFCNTGASARDLTVYVHAKGDALGKAVARVALTAGFAAGNDLTLGDERWTLTEGQAIEAQQATGTDVTYHLSILERAI